MAEKKSEEKIRAYKAPSRLYRSEKNRCIGGVAGGVGEYYNIDPTIIRLLFVLFALIHGSGILFYIILWVVLPEKSKAINNIGEIKDIVKNNVKEMREGERSRTLIGILVLIFGVVILFNNLGFRIWFDIGKYWPVLLIILGFYLLSKK